MTDQKANLDLLCINTIRTLSIDAVQTANSGHPGLPLGAAPMAYILWHRHMRHNPQDPTWANRDRFVLSAGHGSILLYTLLHLSGYQVSMDDLKNFRQWESPTPGHPESFMTAGVEATTGPLGQGSANAVGMAIAERALANRYNQDGYEIVDHHTYALVSDGDLMEGISAEAASLAGHLGLGKLIYLFDSNDISLDGPTALAFTEDIGKRYEAYGWQVLHVHNGNSDLEAIDQAIAAAKADSQRPSIIIVKTTIGFGSPNKQGSASAHGSPLGAEEIRLTKESLGWTEEEAFVVPEPAQTHFEKIVTRGEQAQKSWQNRFTAFSNAHPDLADQWRQTQAGDLPQDWDSDLPTFEANTALASRVASGQVLNAIAAKVPNFFGGDADLSCSTKTAIKEGGSFHGRTGAGRNIHYGVREHAMGAIANGICYHGGLRNYTATFFCFSDYMRPAMRIAALSKLNPIYVFTHDSIGVGEDGPTHQPVEHLASLRAMPNMLVIRPGDANETREAWRVAMMQSDRPTTLVFSRQNLTTLPNPEYASAEGLLHGAYVLKDSQGGEPEAILIATGSELQLAAAAQRALDADGIRTRLVSMPCWRLFEEQTEEYRQQVLPSHIATRVAIEAGTSFGWHRWVGDRGFILSMDRFGASAPGNKLLDAFGFTEANISTMVKQALGKG